MQTKQWSWQAPAAMAEELAEERRLQAHLVGQVVFAVGTAGIAVASGVWVAKSDVGTALVRNSIVKYHLTII